jgi:uncharacterized membrane protein
MTHMDRTGENDLLFDAVLRPHRSLSKLGFLIFMAALATISFAAGILFLLQGAWPVFGFFGLEVGLVYIAFKLNYRSGRLTETVQLDAKELLVRRVDPAGRAASWTFQPNWLRVSIDNPPEHESQLVLTSHGRSLTIGSFLTPEERLEVAQGLRAALARWREPSRG